MGRTKGKRMLDTTLSYWKNFRVKDTDIKALKQFLDDPYSEDKLKLQILGWLWDNLGKINANDPKTLNPKFHEEMQTFLALIEMRS